MCIMKKSVLIVVLGVGLALVSCEKQDIQPRTNADIEETPVWESSTAPSATATTTAPTTSTGTSGTSSAGDDSDSGGITDPNDDEDGNGRKKV